MIIMLEYFKFTLSSYGEGYIETEVFLKGNPHYHVVGTKFEDFERSITDKQANYFNTRMTLLNLDHLERQYMHSDQMLLDGETWSIEYQYANKPRESIFGDNSYPDCWEKLLDILDELVEEVPYVDPERIESFTMHYHHKLIIENNEQADYEENLDINRKHQTLIYTKNIAPDCVITHQYETKHSISTLLDNLNGDIPDIQSAEVGEYEEGIIIDITWHNGELFHYQLPYNRHYMPRDWHNVMYHIEEYMRTFGFFGSIFAQSIYEHGVHEGEYIYCSIIFEENARSYYYVTDDDSIRIGDYVLVPIGHDNKEVEGVVENITYHYRGSVPYPYESCKHIIKKLKH